MSGVVAASAFAASVFVVYLLWASRMLGAVGLLASFAVGMISYSMDASIEMAVAAIIVAGIAIKYALPLVQAKWVEAGAAKEAFEGNAMHESPEKVIRRLGAMKGGAKEVEGFSNNMRKGVEGFEDATAANASAATAPATAGGVALPGATVQSAQAAAPAAPVAPTMPAAVPALPPGATGAGAGTGMPSAMTGNMAVGAAGAAADSARVASNIAALPAATPGQITVPVASPTASAPIMMPVNMAPTAMAAPSAAPVTGMPSTASAPGAAARAAPMGAPLAMAPGAAGATPLTATIPGASGSIAAPVGPPLPSTLPAAVAPAAPGMTPGTAVPPAAGQQATVATALAPGAVTQGFSSGIEKFQAESEDGLFKLGQLPAEGKNGPHIDAGTTIMRALSSLNPGQISSLTEDTKKLLDTQKSLMGMLNTMKPILSDGAGLLSQFQGMFGK